MGVFSKLWKGVKKVVKKIGKGIKKVVGKIGAAIGKLGIIGQIGMMFLMPYAMSGLSSFFGGVGGKIATWSANLAGSNPVISKFLGAVHKAGSMAVNAYNTVTTAIGNGVDRVGNFFKGKGFTLSGDRTSVFGGVSSSDIPVPELSTEITLNKDGTVNFDTSPNDFGASKVDASAFKEGTLELKAPQTFAEQAVSASTGYTPSDLKPLLTPDAGLAKGLSYEGSQTFGEYIKALPGEIKGGIKDAFADPGQMVTDTLYSGAVTGVSQRVASSIMGDPPIQKQLVTHQNLSQELYNDPTGKYNEVNLALTQQGAPWGAGNLAHYAYMQEGLSDGSDEYNMLMRQIGPVTYAA
jgi:hypothetical protein